MKYKAFFFARKNGFKSIFNPTFLFERNMGIDFFDNVLDS